MMVIRLIRCTSQLGFYTQLWHLKIFELVMDPNIYEYSNIDIPPLEVGNYKNDYFTLFEFSAKYDPVPTMLTQTHLNVIRGFMGQTTISLEKAQLRNQFRYLENEQEAIKVKYIHGNFGRGTFTFYAGHDPEKIINMQLAIRLRF